MKAATGTPYVPTAASNRAAIAKLPNTILWKRGCTVNAEISNYFNVGCGTCAPGSFNVNNYQVSDDVSWIKGKHQLGFGVDFRKEQFNSTNNQQSNAQISFNGNTTGHDR
jgi:predicted heme/steroid binding protein